MKFLIHIEDNEENIQTNSVSRLQNWVENAIRMENQEFREHFVPRLLLQEMQNR